MQERDQTFKEFQENKKKLESLEAKLDDRELDIFRRDDRQIDTFQGK